MYTSLITAMNFMLNGFKKPNTKQVQSYEFNSKVKELNNTSGLFSAIKKAKTL